MGRKGSGGVAPKQGIFTWDADLSPHYERIEVGVEGVLPPPPPKPSLIDTQMPIWIYREPIETSGFDRPTYGLGLESTTSGTAHVQDV
jgi:hypothetical protein